MSSEKQISSKLDMDAKWEACAALGARRFVYSSLVGAVGGLVLFRSPVTRWAAVALGAGIGIGSAYTECMYMFNESSTKPAIPKIADVSTPQAAQE